METINVFAKSKDIARALKIKKNITDDGQIRFLSEKYLNRVQQFNKLFQNVG